MGRPGAVGANAVSRVAVVGAGPAGLYALEALLALPEVAGVDVFDALPAPYGLVRYGVAPDHAKTKSVTRVFDRPFAGDRTRFFGNVRYGRDLHLADLRRHYAATLFATGAPGDRTLGIPGERLPGSDSATRFVAWYSGLPDAPAYRLDATATVLVVGAGNVALDVVRMLAKPAAELAATDVPDAVLARFATSRVRDVHLVARRGPAQAKFSPVELRELGALPDTDILVDPDDLVLDAGSAALVESSRPAATTVRTVAEWAARPAGAGTRRVHLHFWTRPVEIRGEAAVDGVVLERRPPGDAVPRRSTVDAQLVLRAIGYRAHPLPELPFDDDAAVVPHDHGRVAPGVYVAGWLKRGPSGVIGTNKNDALETVRTIAADLPTLPPVGSDPRAMPNLLAARGVHAVDWSGWQRLSRHESSLGAHRDAPTVKVAELATMLDVCGPAAGHR